MAIEDYTHKEALLSSKSTEMNQDVELQKTCLDRGAPQQRSETPLQFVIRMYCYTTVIIACGYILFKGLQSPFPTVPTFRWIPSSKPDPLKDLCIDFNGKVGRISPGQTITDIPTISYPRFDFKKIAGMSTRLGGPECEPIVYTSKVAWGFNISTHNPKSIEWSLLDLADSHKHSRLQGGITVERGSDSQRFDIEAWITVRSTDRNDVNNVRFLKQRSAIYMGYNPPERSDDVCTEVQIVIRLRPQFNRTIDVFRIWTSELDIWFKPSLKWEINNLSIGSRHGDIAYNNDVYNDPLIVHNATVSSVDGNIFGCYIPDENLNVFNEQGNTGVILVPNLAPDAPAFEPQNISITSKTEIRAVAPMKVWPKNAYTHRTNIHTEGGMLIAQIPHGSYTNLTSNGDLYTYLMPIGNPGSDFPSKIYTNSHSWTSYVYVSGYFLDPGSDALTNTISEHKVGNGSLLLRYADLWSGEMEAEIKEGSVDLQEWQWKIEEESEGYVRAERGDGKSRMRALVDSGTLEVLVWP
ncbi:hypothetical protein BDV96DRAFT_644223 [Lophiotrema nucula]|uniref:Uncharacterized protein n=1 Tax=Lophiotrema nucula TaxID=690887 RepID=A0A6A5ZF60_9PLEO|nr:hypothetical protein BDV96DRAFT_644223 [Lophiotrema nucula]